MITRRPFVRLFALALLASGSGHTWAQCTNFSQYPAAAISPDPTGTLTTIEQCNWQTEYSAIVGVSAGATYEFAYEGGAWVTVHQSTFNGTVLGYGPSPFTVAAPTADPPFVHWNTDSLCGTSQDCHLTTVQLLAGGCVPPDFTTAAVPDCEHGQFERSNQTWTQSCCF